MYRQHLLRQTLPGLQIKQSCGLADDTRTEIDQSNLSLVRVTGLLVVLHEEIGITPAVGASRQRLSNCAQTGRLVSMFGLNIEITGNAILLQCTGEVFFGLQSLPHPAAEPFLYVEFYRTLDIRIFKERGGERRDGILSPRGL